MLSKVESLPSKKLQGKVRIRTSESIVHIDSFSLFRRETKDSDFSPASGVSQESGAPALSSP